jgi:primosomal protein N'
MADCPATLAGPPQAQATRNRLRVLLPVPLPAALDYRAADGEAPPEPGRFVRVDLGPRRLIGVVW